MMPTGVDVHMRLNKVMTSMLVEVDASNREFVERDGTMIVKLDKALYGCVEASNLWYNNLKDKLTAHGFKSNPYDSCVFNKTCKSGAQTTAVVHVDDLMVTSVSESDLNDFCAYLKDMYPETKETRGDVVDYIGMTFDFTKEGEVSVTMDNCVNDILVGSGVTKRASSPATKNLFDVRNAKKLSPQDAQFFHTYVAKLLYLAKRTKPECLAAVAFLATRVTMSDDDDMQKLMRLLGYILSTPHRGITFKIGEFMSVNVFIDAAYGVHKESGKSHTGCAIVLGEGGPLYAKSCKQKIVTKSSTEAEVVGLSDTASQAIHTRNFLRAQGYNIGPATIYQDNKSCMALIKRGGPGSDRSRNIDIKYFWLAERVTNKEVTIKHLGTEKMFANVLTKPVQGRQFDVERRGLTNWNDSV
jgi:Reverse transcriptase (RNA-dependent DNA polymerase)